MRKKHWDITFYADSSFLSAFHPRFIRTIKPLLVLKLYYVTITLNFFLRIHFSPLLTFAVLLPPLLLLSQPLLPDRVPLSTRYATWAPHQSRWKKNKTKPRGRQREWYGLQIVRTLDFISLIDLKMKKKWKKGQKSDSGPIHRFVCGDNGPLREYIHHAGVCMRAHHLCFMFKRGCAGKMLEKMNEWMTSDIRRYFKGMTTPTTYSFSNGKTQNFPEITSSLFALFFCSSFYSIVNANPD